MLSQDDLRELLEAWAIKMRAGRRAPLEQFEASDVVGLCLATLGSEYGVETANKAIKDYGLEELGFNPKESKS